MCRWYCSCLGCTRDRHIAATDGRKLKSYKVECLLLTWCLYRVSLKHVNSSKAIILGTDTDVVTDISPRWRSQTSLRNAWFIFNIGAADCPRRLHYAVAMTTSDVISICQGFSTCSPWAACGPPIRIFFGPGTIFVTLCHIYDAK
jgi:hypothetical protein